MPKSKIALLVPYNIIVDSTAKAIDGNIMIFTMKLSLLIAYYRVIRKVLMKILLCILKEKRQYQTF